MVAERRIVEAIYDVGTLEIFLSEVVGAICLLRVLLDDLKGTMRVVSWIALTQ
jgi:hypothetical protein